MFDKKYNNTKEKYKVKEKHDILAQNSTYKYVT
jgi:hypothetical protein